MSDDEIKSYLLSCGFRVNSQDGILDIFNTSYQITDKHYDPNSSLMTVTTPDNIFTFLWVLGDGN